MKKPDDCMSKGPHLSDEWLLVAEMVDYFHRVPVLSVFMARRRSKESYLELSRNITDFGGSGVELGP